MAHRSRQPKIHVEREREWESEAKFLQFLLQSEWECKWGLLCAACRLANFTFVRPTAKGNLVSQYMATSTKIFIPQGIL